MADGDARGALARRRAHAGKSLCQDCGVPAMARALHDAADSADTQGASDENIKVHVCSCDLDVSFKVPCSVVPPMHPPPQTHPRG